MRSFGIVEFKLLESDFFLEKFRGTRNLREAEFYLSAFLSASRSVTFALQASLGDHPGFSAWYERQREILRKSDVANWFLNARNASQHRGGTFIGSAASANGEARFFEHSIVETHETTMEAAGRMLLESWSRLHAVDSSEDIGTRCVRHLTGLLRVIHSCFETFGPVIDSEQYYTRENMERLGLAIEDFEQELGFPSGWSAGIPDENRFALLRRQAGQPEIDELFCKYLGVNRFGCECDRGK